MPRIPFALCLAGVIVGATTGAMAGCDRLGSSPATVVEAPAPTQAPDETETAGVACELSTASSMIDGLQLVSDDGACRVFLPADPRPGEYEVRVSAAGDDHLAAVEARVGGETLYATTGAVTIEALEGGRIRGRVDAEDATAPATGRVSTSFDVPLPGG